MTEDDLGRARALVRGAGSIVVLTGAGISAESGVPTFRGAGGLWRAHRPEDLATPEAFRRDPCLVWEWYLWRRRVVAGCTPNPGHRSLARLAMGRPDTVTLVTQNVDGLHQRAAAEEAAGGPHLGAALPLELHGAIHRDRCNACGRRSRACDVDTSSPAALPRCEACDGLLRPDVVWFGEMLDADTLTTAFERAHEADVCIVAGTSALVHPAASVPLATLRGGGRLIEVNPGRTPLSDVAAVTLKGPSGGLLPALLG